VVKFAPPHIEINLAEGSAGGLANEIRAFLNKATGANWMVALSDREGEKTLTEQRLEREQAEREAQEAERRKLMDHPDVQAVMEQFPGAEITEVRPLGESTRDDD
jgi:DNA polymerase-3 subunit gamma/tau